MHYCNDHESLLLALEGRYEATSIGCRSNHSYTWCCCFWSFAVVNAAIITIDSITVIVAIVATIMELKLCEVAIN